MRDLARTAVYGVARAGTATIPASTRGLIFTCEICLVELRLLFLVHLLKQL